MHSPACLPHLFQVAHLRRPGRQQRHVDHGPQRQQERDHQAKVGKEDPKFVQQVAKGAWGADGWEEGGGEMMQRGAL